MPEEADQVVQVALKGDSRSLVQSFNNAAEAASNVSKAFASAETVVNRLRSSTEAMARKVAIATAAATAGMVYKIHTANKAFAEFEAGLRNVETVADTSVIPIDRVGDAIRNMALGKTTQDVNDLSKGLYEIYSSGFSGAAGLKILSASQKLATAGLVDTQSAAIAVTAALNAYNLQADRATDVTDTLFLAVQYGQMTFAELSQNVGDWISVSSQLGATLAESSAALAAMTLNGTRAFQASTQLSAIFRQVIKPSERMQKALIHLGTSTGQAMISTYGLEEGLKKLWHEAGENETVFFDMFNDIEAFRGALALVTKGSEKYAEINAKMTDPLKRKGTVEAAMAKQMNSLSAKTQQFKNQLMELRLEVAEITVPMTKFALTVTTSLLHVMNSLPEPIQKVVASLNLLSPILITFGTLWAAHRIKALLFKAAMGEVAKSIRALNAVVKLPILEKFAVQVQNFTGILPLLTKRFALLKTEIQAGGIEAAFAVGKYVALGVAIAGVAYAAYAIVEALRKSEQAGKDFADSLANVGGQDTFTKLTDDLNKVISTANELRHKGGDRLWNKAWQGLQGAGELMNPWDKNDVVQNMAAVDQLDKNGKRMMAMYQAVAGTAKHFDLDQQRVWENVKRGIENGTIDMDAYQKAWFEWERLRKKALDEAGADGAVSPKTAAAMTAAGKVLIGLEQGIADLTKEDNVAIKATLALGSATGDLEKAMKDMGDEAVDVRGHLQAYGDAIDAIFFRQQDFKDAQAGMGAALRGVKEAFLQSGVVLDPWSEKGERVNTALNQMAQATQTLMVETYRQTGSVSEANKVLGIYIQGLVKLARDSGASEDKIKELIRQMALTPAEVQAFIALPGADPALAQLLDVNNMLKAIDGSTTQATVVIDTQAKMHGTSPAAIQDYEARRYGSTAAADAQKAVNQAIGTSVDTATSSDEMARQDALFRAGKTGEQQYKVILQERLKDLNKASSAYTEVLLQIEDINKRHDARMYQQGLMSAGQYLHFLRMRQASLQQGTEEWFNNLNEQNQVWKDYLQGQAEVTGNDAPLLNFLRKRLGSVTKFSSEWMDVWRTIRQIELDYLEKQAKFAGNDSGLLKYLYAQLNSLQKYSADWFDVWEKIAQIEENNINRISNVAGSIPGGTQILLAALNDRLRKAQRYSEEWTDLLMQIKDAQYELINQKGDITQASSAAGRGTQMGYITTLKTNLQAIKNLATGGGADDIMKYLQAVATLRNEELSFMKEAYDQGIMSRQQYMNNLQIMLGQVDQYSQAWFDVKDAIKSVQDQISDEKNKFTDPIRDATDFLKNMSDQGKVTATDIRNYFEYMVSAGTRWKTAIEGLRASGLNEKLLKQLAQMGPQGLNLAEELLRGGVDSISAANAGFTTLESLIGGIGDSFTSILPDQTAAPVQQINFDVANLSVQIPVQAAVTASDVEDALCSALDQLAQRIKRN